MAEGTGGSGRRLPGGAEGTPEEATGVIGPKPWFQQAMDLADVRGLTVGIRVGPLKPVGSSHTRRAVIGITLKKESQPLHTQMVYDEDLETAAEKLRSWLAAV